jgi:hypothetical protein
MKRLAIVAIACGLAVPAARALEPLPPDAGQVAAVEPPIAASAAPSVQTAPPLPLEPVPSERGARSRDSWYIGFGLGSGGGSARIGDESHAFKDLVGRSATTGAINFRVGATVTPKLLVGFDGGAVGTHAFDPTESFQLNYYDVGVMFFPWVRGAFGRAAVGRSVFTVDTDGPVLAGKGTFGGWNALGGIGYAFWLGKAFNLTVNVEYQAHFFPSSGPIEVSRGGGWSSWVGFDWY